MTTDVEKIGKYRILDIAGQGAMGIVYLGHDPFINRKVAIKVCSDPDEHGSVSDRSRRIFFNEAQAAGTLDHANILRVYDAGEADNQPYIVMEYIAGGATLKSYCSPESLLPIPKVVEIIYKCAKALDYAHHRGVLHRDIKPANIMMAEDDEPKIGDFGIAQLASAETTQLMSAVGSPRYMSPEQASEEELSGQTDLYSLGVTLYEMLAGRPPHNQTALPALMLAITTKQATPIRDIRPEIPQELADIVHRSIERDLSVRYKLGNEFAEALGRYLDQYSQPSQRILNDEEKFKKIREAAFFNDFSDKELQDVMEVGSWEQYRPGEPIIVQESKEHAFLVLCSGDATVEISGKEIGIINQGECIGEAGFLMPIERFATVKARSDVSAVKIEGAIMDWASIPVQMRFNKAFQKTLIERLIATSRELAERT